MKFNFGTGLFIGAFLFIAFVVALVIIINQTDVSLVEEKYYENGVRYQEEINRNKEADLLVSITYDKDISELIFKKFSVNDTIFGNAYFYRPSDASKDFSIDVLLIDSSGCRVNTSKLDKGIWKIKLRWKAGNKEYQLNRDIII